MANVGYASLVIIPSVRGISDELRSQLIGPAGDAGTSAGDSAGRSFSAAFSAAAAGGMKAANAGLKGVAGGAKLFSAASVGLGGGLAVLDLAFGKLGITALKTNKTLVDAYTTTFTKQIPADAAKAASSLVGPLDKAIGEIGSTVRGLVPELSKAFEAVAPVIQPLTSGIGDFATNALPGFVTGLQGAAAPIDAVAGSLGTLGTAVAGMLSNLAEGSEGGAEGISSILDLVSGLLPSVGDIVGQLGGAGGKVIAPLSSQISKLTNSLITSLLPAVTSLAGPVATVTTALGSALGPTIAGLARPAAVLGQALAALAPAAVPLITAAGTIAGILVGALTPAIGTVAAIIHALVPVVVAVTGSVLKAFGPALREVTPLVAALGGALVTVLRPVLGVLPSLLAPLAAVLGTLARVVLPLAAGFAAALAPSLSHLPALVAPVLAAFSAMVPALAPLTHALTGALSTALTQLATTIGVTLAAALPALAPALGSLAVAFAQLLVAAVPLLTVGTQLATAVLAVLTPALPPLVTGLGAVTQAVAYLLRPITAAVGFITANKIALGTLAVIAGTLAVAMNTAAIATAASTAVYEAQFLALRITTAATEGFAAAQEILNAVMDTNPVVLVVLAIVALAAAVVLAYQHVGWFRAAVQAAWAGIQTAASFAWNILKSVFAALVVAVTAVANAAVWLWRNVLAPAFSFIGTAARILATILTIVLLGPAYLAFKLLGGIALWLWHNAISPVVGWIITAAGLLWTSIKFNFGLLMTGFRLLGAVAVWLWTNAIHPVVGWISTGFGLLWASVQASLHLGEIALRALGTAGLWLWHTALSPALHGIAELAVWLYDKGIKPPIDSAVKLAHAFGAAFKSAATTIGTEFGKIAGWAKKPIAYVIDTVYNRGIVGVWNPVAAAFGAPKLAKFKGFATGGAVFGAGTETSDDVPAWLSRGEHVWTAKEVRGAGGHGPVMAMRKWAAAGGSGALPGFKDGGGLFGWVGKEAAGAGSAAWNLAKKGADWLKDTLAASAHAGVNAVVNPLLKHIPGADSGFGQMIAGIPSRMVDALFGYAKEADAKGASASASAAGGGQLGAWIAQAIAATHVPGSWAGPLRTLVMRESGGNPRAINLSDSNAKAGDPSRGLMQTIGSTFEHYRLKGLPDDIFNPIANLAAGIRYILSRYGTIFNVQQANARLTSKGYASGTSGAARGWAWVGERGPELVNFGGGETVLPHGQSLRTAAALGALGGYATGTASARKAVPGDLGGFTKSLVGSASSIADAAKTLAADLLAAGGAGKALATRTGQVSAKLQSLATARDALAATIAAAKQFAADQAQNARDYLGLSNLGDTTSVGGLISGLTTRQDTVKAFKGEVDTAAKHGASKDLISQLIGLGPDSGLTQLVAGASAAQLKQLNALIASGGKLATSYGNDFADQMYDTGADAGKGFLVGLQDQEKALQAEMTKLGSGLVASIRKALDSHSPAQKLVAVGHDVGAGLAIGVDDTTSAVAAAAARMADAAAPAPAPAQLPASTARSAASGLASRTPVRLVVGDREFTAYLEEVADGRVDSALIKVRRRAGAGHKG